MKDIKKLMITLVALIAVTTGAWAQTALNVAELTIPDTWQNDNTALSTNDLPGYQVATRDNAIAWTGAPEGYAKLFFDVTSSEIKSATFYNGNYSNDGSSIGLNHSTLYTWKNSASYRFFYTTAPSAASDVTVAWDKDVEDRLVHHARRQRDTGARVLPPGRANRSPHGHQ